MLRLLRIFPIEATVMPFPTELSTPPVINIYFGILINYINPGIPPALPWEFTLGITTVSGNTVLLEIVYLTIKIGIHCQNGWGFLFIIRTAIRFVKPF